MYTKLTCIMFSVHQIFYVHLNKQKSPKIAYYAVTSKLFVKHAVNTTWTNQKHYNIQNFIKCKYLLIKELFFPRFWFCKVCDDFVNLSLFLKTSLINHGIHTVSNFSKLILRSWLIKHVIQILSKYSWTFLAFHRIC